MLEIIRTYKFRLKPTLDQEAILDNICAAVRTVYNAANEQRILYQKKTGNDWHGRNTQFHKYGQNKEIGIRELKKDPELSWLTEYATAASFSMALADLQQAWDTIISARSKGQRTRDPVFRNMREDNSFRVGVWTKTPKQEIANVVFGRHFVRLPKIGYVKYVKHRKMRGKFKTATVTREGKRWYICVSAVITVADPKQRPTTYVGIDLGTTVPIALSDGTEIPFVKIDLQKTKKQRILQQKLSRAKKRSRRREVLREKLAAQKRRETARKRVFLHTATTALVREFTHIAREDLSVRDMTQSAKSRRKQGKKTVSNVIQAKFNRAFLEVPKYTFGELLEYKAAQFGSNVVTVDPAFTSQTCSACGNVSKKSRIAQLYHCVACGHSEHADTNAAKNVLKKAFPNAVLNTVGVRSEPRKTPSEDCKPDVLEHLQTSATSNPVGSLFEGRGGSHFQVYTPKESLQKSMEHRNVCCGRPEIGD